MGGFRNSASVKILFAGTIAAAIGQGQARGSKVVPLTILVPGGGVVAGVHLVAGLSLVSGVGVVVIVVVPLL